MRDPIQALEDDAERLLEEHHLPGFGIAISKANQTIYAGAFGLWNVEEQLAARSDSSYSLASVTKGFTGTSIAILAHEGKLNIDDPIGKYVPDTLDRWDAVTLRHLLTHTSEIPCYLNDVPPEDCVRDITAIELIDRVRHLPLKFEPGNTFSYGNTGNVLLGMVISHLSNMTWSEFFQRRLFEPVGMTNTRVILTMEGAVNARVIGYVWENGSHQPCTTWNPAWADAAGGIVTTADDMAKWGSALHGGQAIPDDVLGQIWSATVLTDGNPLNVGFGWNVNEDDGGRRRHTGYGGGPGISSHICVYPDQAVTVSAFSNIGDVFGPLAELAQGAAKRVMA